MSDDKTYLTEVRGWTPLIDALVARYGIIGAAVYGRVWRYCQGPDGVCWASLARLARDLNINRSTLIFHLSILVVDGYIKDHTPNQRFKPHTYSCTNKAQLRSVVWAEIKQENLERGLSLKEIQRQVDQVLGVGNSNTYPDNSGQVSEIPTPKEGKVSEIPTPGVGKSDTKIQVNIQVKGEEIFNKIRLAVLDTIGEARDQTSRLSRRTVEELTLVDYNEQENTFRIGTQNDYLLTWCNQRLVKMFEHAITGVTGRVGVVAFEIEEQPA